MQFNDDELNEFKQEAIELIDRAEVSLLALSKGELFASHFDEIFRSFHSVKGAAGMVGAVELQSHMHDLESFFSTLKDNISIEQSIIDRLLRGCDKARLLLGQNLENNTVDKIDNSFPDSAVKEFVAEANELIQRLNSTLSNLEKEGFNSELMSSLYRDIHTIKGSSGLFGFNTIASLSHAIESRLEDIRSQKEKLNPELCDLMYKAFDIIESLIASVASNSNSDKIDSDAKSLEAAINATVLKHTSNSLNEEQSLNSSDSVLIAPVLEDSLKIIKDKKIANSAASNVEDNKNEVNQTLRVSVELLDRLMTLVGEMVLVRNQVIQYSNRNDDLVFINLSQRLDVVTSEIQAEVMKTRMQPLGSVLNKFQRVVRDMARDLGKKIEIHFFGSETELDKALLEAVKDPLMHIVRNACDHGIELPQERINQNKDEVGNITIKAFHEGGQVIIEIIDDGKGLNKERIIAKAIEKNILRQDKLSELTDKDIYNFIFAPGFSTASSVTNISGRGVGMDVVKRNIEKIGGIVDLESNGKNGTTIRLKIPLTLAIVPAMIVKSGDSHFAIPQVKLVELVRVERDKGASQIEMLQGVPVYRLRGQLLPIIDLRRVLDIPESDIFNSSSAVNIVVVNGDSLTFGLVVDEVQDTADIVVKPLSQLLKSLSIYSGATVLGDGSISLILDIAGIALNQNMNISGTDNELLNSNMAINSKVSSEVNEFLLVRLASGVKHAIPLSMVQRMEEFNISSIETSGEVELVQYRETILPLISLDYCLKYPNSNSSDDNQKIPVVVTRIAGKLVGIKVTEILDVVFSNQILNDSCVDRPGILGNFVHMNEVIVVVDVYKALENVPFLKNDYITKVSNKKNKKKILFAEDTEFFRRHVTQILVKAGYEVVSAEHGKQALSFLLASDNEFDMVLTDIEMPEMSGLQLAKEIRSHEKYKNIPLIALTTRYNPKDVDSGIKAGFNAYLEKLNPEILIKQISNTLEANMRKGVA